ncbi:hypothetical protein LOK74_20685 [Brevibacillus humidisoli]|uniref:hypothetical protein n=1 Tax=Brevibacillus humidisoli TaxID=2895522 RepID=UPI001E50C56A|nr:hypothetical protein [Brevibacillus humidisoli]UFJ40421.1 hypothetical protein LOK74_20685 [Brevibacillus humidisoli]
MSERNILAGFRSVDEAERAAEQLRKAGFQTVQVETIDRYPGEDVQQVINPISGQIPSLGALTLGADFPSGRDASVMAAADPSASGMSDGDQDSGGANILLTAVVPEQRGDEAVQLIRSLGGEV